MVVCDINYIHKMKCYINVKTKWKKESKLKTAIYLWYRVYLNLNYVYKMFSNPEREYVKTNLTCLLNENIFNFYLIAKCDFVMFIYIGILYEY